MSNNTKQFVIQQHTTPNGVHWDLMLEMDDTLWTWRLNIPPAEMGVDPTPAERIHNHPLRFLTYEGPVQNKTGNVTIADKGTYTEIIKEVIEVNTLTIEFKGKILRGIFTLYQIPEENLWTLKKQDV